MYRYSLFNKVQVRKKQNRILCIVTAGSQSLLRNHHFSTVNAILVKLCNVVNGTDEHAVRTTTAAKAYDDDAIRHK